MLLSLLALSKLIFASLWRMVFIRIGDLEAFDLASHIPIQTQLNGDSVCRLFKEMYLAKGGRNPVLWFIIN